MNEELNPVEMIEPGSGRNCTVQGRDVTEFEKRGYRRVDQLHIAAPAEETAGDEAGPEDGLEALTNAELRARLADAGLDASKARKSDLVDRLRAAAAEAAAAAGDAPAEGGGGEGDGEGE